MTLLSLPWLEIALLTAMAGALCVSPLRDPVRAWRGGVAFTGAALACTLLACLGFYWGVEEEAYVGSLNGILGGDPLLRIDELNAPLLPLVALLHFLTALATGRTKMRRFSLSWSLTSEGIRLTALASVQPWLLIGLLAADTVPGYVELINRGRPTRVYALHMGLFIALLIIGWSGIDPTGSHDAQPAWAAVALLAAMLIRCGTIPAHCWLTDWFEHASLGNALLFVTPLTGVYAALRLVLPITPDWVLHSLGVFSLFTSVYAAGMALVQHESRRFFAYLFLSHASLILVGLELHTPISLAGALSLWISASLSLAGFGLTLRALEARFGRLSLADFHGLYDHSPALAVCFLITGLASVGFPGTLGFIAGELLIDGAVEANPYVGGAVMLATALNGIAVVRAYFYLFTGARHSSTVSLAASVRERVAVLTLIALILGGGIYPQPGVASRYQAAQTLLRERAAHAAESAAVFGPSSLDTEPALIAWDDLTANANEE